MWGQAPIEPLAAETWRVLCGWLNLFVPNIALLMAPFYHRSEENARANLQALDQFTTMLYSPISRCQSLKRVV